VEVKTLDDVSKCFQALLMSPQVIQMLLHLLDRMSATAWHVGFCRHTMRLASRISFSTLALCGLDLSMSFHLEHLHAIRCYQDAQQSDCSGIHSSRASANKARFLLPGPPEEQSSVGGPGRISKSAHGLTTT
jgi:hypothetical protein